MYLKETVLNLHSRSNSTVEQIAVRQQVFYDLSLSLHVNMLAIICDAKFYFFILLCFQYLTLWYYIFTGAM